MILDVESYASRLATARLIENLPGKGVDTIVALFEVGALTTSMQVMRNQEVLYDRDQAFGGAQLTQLIVRQYGFSPKRPKPRSAAATCPTTTAPACSSLSWKASRRKSARALQFFFTSTPHNKVDYVLLAGGSSASLPGLTDAVTQQTSFACSWLNPFDGMELVRQHPRKEGAARGAVLPDLLRSGHAEVPAVILINLLPHREAARKRGARRSMARWAALPWAC
jgi:type IV pilus assembly protein PilM